MLRLFVNGAATYTEKFTDLGYNKITMKKYGVFFLLFLGMSERVLAESLYFSCLTKVGLIVLQMDAHDLKYAVYKNGAESFYFKSKQRDNGGFKYNHYSRFQTDYFNVSFYNGNYKYSVFSNYDDGVQAQGVTAFNLNNKKEITYKCKKTNVDRLSELSLKLQCDIHSSLGC